MVSWANLGGNPTARPTKTPTRTLRWPGPCIWGRRIRAILAVTGGLVGVVAGGRPLGRRAPDGHLEGSMIWNRDRETMSRPDLEVLQTRLPLL